jgi:hypothetical protein
MSFNFGVARRHIFLTVLLSLMTLTANGADMNKLGDYQWKNRLILIHAEENSGNEVETLRTAQVGIDDRDLIWFVNTGSGLVSNQAAVSSRLESEVTGLLEENRLNGRVLLIGKDGGIKSRESDLNLDAIFRRIDAMPMRAREMRDD